MTTNQDKLTSTEFNLKPAAKFSRNTESSNLSGTINTNFRQYPEEKGLNDENLNLSIDANKSYQQSNFRLNLGANKDTTLDSELEESGIVLGRADRMRKSLSPSWSWQISERSNINLKYTYNAVNYDNNSFNYVDSESHAGSISFNRILQERSTLSLVASQRLTSNDNDVLSRYTNIQAGYSYNLSETLSTALFVGARKTTTKYSQEFFLANFIPFSQQIKIDETGSVFNASITKTNERGKFTFDISRDISNSVSGRLIEVTHASIDNSYKFSSRLSASLMLDYYQSLSASDVSTINNLDSEYYTIKPSLLWQMSPHWSIAGNYQFKKQANDSSVKNAIQNSFYINLTYQWPRIAISR